MEKRYDIFIPYRREGGESTAKMIHDKLHNLGYQVFFDVESLRSGLFNVKLYSVIDECKDVVVILSPGSLDRCESEKDWVRREIEYALQKGKNVIPIMLRGFEFPDKLPESIENLQYMQGLRANLEYFDAFVDKLQSFLLTKPPFHVSWKKAAIVCASVLAVVVMIVALAETLSGLKHSDSDTTPTPNAQVVDPTTDNTNETTETSSPVPAQIADEKLWQNNILMEQSTQNFSEDSNVLGSDIARKEILSVTFLDSLDEMPDNAWDVSAEQNEKVMAWTVARDGGYDLYIGGSGGVEANKNSSCLFQLYTNVESIHINGNLHTENVYSMSYMFHGCHKLTSLDVNSFDTSNVTDMFAMFSECHNIKELNLTNFDTSNVTEMGYMFFQCSNAEELKIGNFNTSRVIHMDYMFYGCSKLTTLDVSRFDTSNVTEMNAMFSQCSNIKELKVDHFKTSEVTNMGGMFYGCKKLITIDVSDFDTSYVTNMSYMFYECNNLTELDVSKFDTSKVASMDYMFFSCSSITDLDVSNFKTSSVTNMEGMFHSCSRLTALDVSGFDTSNVENMYLMFYRCSDIKELNVDKFDTSKVKNMGYMFYECSKLTTLNVSDFDTSNVTNMAAMFERCRNLKSLDVQGFNTSHVTDATNMFKDCNNLKELNLSNFSSELVENMGITS